VRLAQAIYLWLYVRNTNEKKKSWEKEGLIISRMLNKWESTTELGF
jgi:hypothetical protein